jgi:hypothetical protein
MIIFGWVRRGIVLATKRDYCVTCAMVTTHRLVRIVTFATLFWLPVAPVWVSHVLVCDQCGARRKLGWRQVRAALRTGTLPLPPRPEWQAWARRVFEETNRTPREAELDPIEKNPRPGPWDTYLRAWLIVVPAVIVGLIVASLIP